MKRCIVSQAVCQPRFFRMATQLAKSAKKRMPDVDTVLLTDLPGRSPWVDKIIRLDPVKLVNAHLIRLTDLPVYDSGIWLDADTYICAPLYDVFELVEDSRIDIAVVHTSGKKWNYPACGVPTAFPHPRGAFIAFQDHDGTRSFFALWSQLFREHQKKYDMAHEGPCYPNRHVLRVALYRSALSIAVLRPKYCTTLGGVVIRGTVRVIAGEGDLKKLAQEANRDTRHARFFHQGKATKID